MIGLPHGVYDKKYRMSNPGSPVPTHPRNTSNHFAGSAIRGGFISKDNGLRNRSIDLSSHCDLMTFNQQSHSFIRPGTANLLSRQAFHSRIPSQQISPRQSLQQSPNRYLPNNTLLRNMLSNKGSQIKMPLASTFNKKQQLGMLSKDQLLMIQKTSQTTSIRNQFDLHLQDITDE